MEELRSHLSNIQEEPKIPLKNYLLRLVDKQDSIFMWNIQHIVKEVWNEIIKRNKTIGVRKIIPAELKMSTSHFYAVKNGKVAISIKTLFRFLSLWKRYCNKSSQEVKEKLEKIYQTNFKVVSYSKSNMITLPKFITPKLSYLIGWIVGDGNLDSHKNKCQIRIYENNKNTLNKLIKPLTIEIFNSNPSLMKHKTKNCYILSIRSKPIFKFLKDVLKIKVGEIPEVIKNADIVNKKFFIRGLFDAEGDVSKIYSRSRWSVRISQNNFNFLKDIQYMLKEMGILTKGPYHFSGAFSIAIYKKFDILNFKKLIGSSHPNKAKKLENLSQNFINAINFRYTNKIIQNRGDVMVKKEMTQRIIEVMKQPERIRNVATASQ